MGLTGKGGSMSPQQEASQGLTKGIIEEGVG